MGSMRVLAAVLWAATAHAAGDSDPLRVGTSGDYPPFSAADAGELRGFDVDVARAYAEERGRPLEFVPFAWPELVQALREGRFDVAMSGITVRPERSAAGRFTVPVTESGAVVLVRKPTLVSSIDEVDRRGLRLGVNAGGHLEQVARTHFPKTTLVAIPSNTEVLRALRSGTVDAAVTDTREAPHWERAVADVRRLGPFTRDRKALLVGADEATLASDLDTWLLEREADGSLAALRQRHFGRTPGSATALPLEALVAALDERLALMPAVTAAKRAAVRPIAAPRRERVVVAAGIAAVHAAAERSGRPVPNDAAVKEFYAAQIAAAREIQMAAGRDPDFTGPEPALDLDAALRPALLRIGERIAALVVALPTDLEPGQVTRVCNAGLRAAWLSVPERNALCVALRALAAAPRTVLADQEPGERTGQQGKH
ncbi:MAG: transporter substrate-binding domain-containing protein [Myxococcota bacterium]|nr:transporter substrate-binding domain-containing protein [Myxococcota bacterium]